MSENEKLNSGEVTEAAAATTEIPSPRAEPDQRFVPVKRSDVAPYAKKQCKTCSGTGKLVREKIGPDWAKREEVLCGCALRQFQKYAQKGQIETRLEPIYASADAKAEGKVLHYQLQWIPCVPPPYRKQVEKLVKKGGTL